MNSFDVLSTIGFEDGQIVSMSIVDAELKVDFLSWQEKLLKIVFKECHFVEALPSAMGADLAKVEVTELSSVFDWVLELAYADHGLRKEAMGQIRTVSFFGVYSERPILTVIAEEAQIEELE